MSRGGYRPGAGRKPKGVGTPNPQPKRLAPPGMDRPRAERMAPLGPMPDLDPMAVMQANMEFYHEQSGELLASILAMPAGDAGDRLEALMRFADMARMRSAAQECARDVAKYRYHPMGAQPYVAPPPDPDAGKPGSGTLLENNPELEGVMSRFTGARQAAQPAPAHTNGHATNGKGFNGGGHNGTGHD